MPKMSDFNFEALVDLYNALSDFYFEVPEEETSQEERDTLNSACEAIMDVLSAHADTPERANLLP